MTDSTRKILVYGGKGALGSALIDYFKSKNIWTLSIDISANENANSNIILNDEDSWTAQETEILKSLEKIMGDKKFDAIFCVAGGWVGSKADDSNFIMYSDLMWKQNVWSSVIAAKIATQYLKSNGLLQLTSAAAALDATPTMISYGMAKAAVIHLIKSLSSKSSGLPNESTVLAILPNILDTTNNRKFMPNANFTSFTPLEFIAEKFFTWTFKNEERPKSGSLIKLITKNSNTELSIV